MAEQTGPETRPIEFADRTFETVRPTDGQYTVVVRMGFWRRNYGEEVDTEDTAKYEKQLGAVNRLFELLGSLFADPADWSWIEDRMADGSIPQREVLDILVKILRVWNDQPTNRAERRAKKTTAKRIQVPPVSGRAP